MKNISSIISKALLVIITLAFLVVSTHVLLENKDIAVWYKALTKSVFQKSRSAGQISVANKAKILKNLPPLSSEYLSESPQRLVKNKGKACSTYYSTTVQHPLQRINTYIAARYLFYLSFSNSLYLLFRTLLI